MAAVRPLAKSQPQPLHPKQQSPLWKKLYEQGALDPRVDMIFFAVLLLTEALLSVMILRFVAYTEIDWQAYMQEVAAWWDEGITDYVFIKGATGPLVYPAGFVYLFQYLRWVTQEHVPKAQLIFAFFYLAMQCLVWLLFLCPIRNARRSREIHAVWRWRIAMGMTCLSKRLHSIFLLRLFNDGPTMLLFYLAANCFARQHWDLGCVIFSLAVSIKMNVLLFAPGLLLLLLQCSPDIATVVRRLAVGCALPQLVLGAPFLLRHPVSYLRKAFELDRVFFISGQ